MVDSIFLSEPEPPEPKSRGAWFIVGLLFGVGALLVASCAGMVGLFYVAFKKPIDQARAQFRQVEMPPVEIETAADRQADLQRGFGGALPADAATLAQLKGLFDKMIRAAQADDSERFRSLVDARQFMEEVKKTGRVKDLIVRDQVAYISDYQNRWISIPGHWDRYRIVNVRPLAGGRFVAYVYCGSGSDAFWTQAMRFWVIRAGRNWKFYDWEHLHIGTRLSFEAAVYNQYSDNDPRLVDHLKATDEITDADRLFDEGKLSAAAATLASAERRTRIPELADHQLIMLALAWHRQGRTYECVRCARQIASPLAAPGGLYLRSLICLNRQLPRRALNLAEQYVAAVGGSPSVHRLMAQARTRLGEHRAAVEDWKNVLSFNPDDPTALAGIARLLDATGGRELVELLQNSSQPAAQAATLLEQIIYAADRAVAQELVDLIVTAEPDSARAAFAQGLVRAAARDHAGAAGFYQSAFERTSDPDEREGYVARYLNAMAAADRIVEGYSAAPDPEAAFRHFAEWDEDEDSEPSRPKLRLLIEAHRARHSDDPWLHFAAGRLLQSERNFPAAEQELTAALEHAADDAQRSRFRTALIDLLHEAGRDQWAYERLAPASEVFQRLVQLHQWKSQAGILNEIYRLHNAAQPDDPWLPFCAAVIAKSDGKQDEALKLALQACQAAGDATLSQQFRWLAISLGEETGNFEALYSLFPDPDTALAELAQRQGWNPDQPGLGRLLDQHVQKHPRTPTWEYWNAHRLWTAGDYGAIAAAGARGPAFVAGWKPHEVEQFHNWHVRSLVKLGRIDEALRVATALSESWCDDVPLEVVELHRRNAPGLRRLLADRAPRTYEINQLYRDPDDARVLAEDVFRPVREEFPRPLPYLWSRSFAVLLLQGSVPLSTEALQQVASEVPGGDCRVDVLNPPAAPAPAGGTAPWLIRLGDARIIVTAGGGLFHEKFTPGEPPFRSQQLASAVSDHDSWLRFELLNSSRASDFSTVHSADFRRLVARFLDPRVRALYWSETGRLIEYSAELPGQLAADDKPALPELAGESVSFDSAGEDEALIDSTEKSVPVEDLARLAVELSGPGPRTRSVIKVERSVGPASELLEFDLVRVVRTEFRDFILTGSLRTESNLDPQLIVGEPYSIYSSQVKLIERLE
jgi:hypothetical protein